MTAVNVQAETVTWKQFLMQGNATKVGAVYAATCNACMGGDYVSHSVGYWQCDNTPDGQGRACASAIVKAIMGKFEG